MQKGKDYLVSYPEACKELGRYELVITAAEASGEYEGFQKVPYMVIEKEHKWSAWKTVMNPTVLKPGEKQRVCSVCHKKESAEIGKIKATISLNMKTITLKVNQTTSKFKVKFAAGDSVRSYQSSNKKIFTVDGKGRIRAKKKGTANLTVTLESGKKATAKVKVQNGTVNTSRLTVNTSRVVLLKKGTYSLQTSLEPMTSQQKITYSSSNKKVASVNSKGVITARKKGKAKITVRSGNKKKTVAVTVQSPSFPKGDGNAFLNSCQKIAKIIMTDGNWIYYTGTGVKKSFTEARDSSPRQTNCASYVNFCMQDFGTLEPGMAFYGNSKGKLTYNGSASKCAATKKLVEKNYDIINVGGKKAVNAGLQPGDICLYKGHTNVYAGLNSDGVPLWYDAGRGSTSDGKPQSGYFTNMYRAAYYNTLPVYVVLRLKQ